MRKRLPFFMFLLIVICSFVSAESNTFYELFISKGVTKAQTKCDISDAEVRALINSGADVNERFNLIYGNDTPLLITCYNYGNLPAVKALMDNGADVNCSNNVGETPLMNAAQHALNPGMVSLLIQKGADVNATDSLGRTALYWACTIFPMTLSESDISLREEIVRILLSNGADVEVHYKNGLSGSTTALHTIAMSGTTSIGDVLLKGKADINIRDEDGTTPIMYAVYNTKSNEMIDWFINNGADVYARDYNGGTILMNAFASPFVNAENLEYLIEQCKQNIDDTDYYGKTALMAFCGSPYVSPHSDNIRGIIKLLIGSKGVNAQDSYEMTALMYAAKSRGKRAKDFFSTLIELGADRTITDSYGKTAIDYANENTNIELKEYVSSLYEPFKTTIKGSAGYVFYDKGYYSDGWRYLEAAPCDLRLINGSPSIDRTHSEYYTSTSNFVFGYYRMASSENKNVYVNGTDKYSATNCTKLEIGQGQNNTRLLISAMGDTAYSENKGNSVTKNYAAKLCEDLIYVDSNGTVFDDWFLPSKDELVLMYNNLCKQDKGEFNRSSSYWSSSEFYGDKMNSQCFAWQVYFGNGNETGFSYSQRYDGNRHYTLRIRPIRAF